MILTAEELVTAIAQLPNNRQYSYVNLGTTTRIVIDHIVRPHGPIYIKRFDPAAGQSVADSKRETISPQMLWRIANAFRESAPINFDRVLASSYNTRSALEALLAHTPQFYFCYPGRVEVIDSRSTIQVGHKHLLWQPSKSHENGVMHEYDVTDMTISEIPVQQAVYDSLSVPTAGFSGVDIDIVRRHAQIQIALAMIAHQFNYRTWIAQNDRGIIYQGNPISDIDGVIPRLSEGTVIQYWGSAVEAAKLIDCIWFDGEMGMPAVIEVEHTTGVTSGLVRMKNFQDNVPNFPTRFVIAAPDEDRKHVIREIGKEQFRSLDARYMPYSAVEELWNLCERRQIQGMSESFLDSYMEKVI